MAKVIKVTKDSKDPKDAKNTKTTTDTKDTKDAPETNESQRAQEKKYEQEMEDNAEWGAEEKRLRAIRAKRRTAGECIMCGKPLGFWDKRAKREKHEACTQWKE